MQSRRQFLAVAGSVALVGCGSDSDDGTDAPTDAPDGTTVEFSSEFDVAPAAFEAGGSIPERYTGVGEDVSPPLAVESVPEGTETLALVFEDPDAPEGPFVHWLLWNVPAETDEIPEDLPQEETLADLDGARQGTNDFDEIGYRGPFPPEEDDPHTYRFTISALDTSLDLEAGATRDELDAALEGNRIGLHTINARFGR